MEDRVISSSRSLSLKYSYSIGFIELGLGSRT